MLMSKYPQVKTNDWLWMMIFVKIISIWTIKKCSCEKLIQWNRFNALFPSPYRTPTSALWLMLSKASCEYAELKRVVQSEMALFVDSVERHKANMPRADSSTHCTFSISWKIVKLFIVSMKKVQNALRVKNRKIVPAKKSKLIFINGVDWVKMLNARQKVENHFASLIF